MMMQTQFNNKVGKRNHSGSLSIEIQKQKILTKIHENFLIKKHQNAPIYNNYLYIKYKPCRQVGFIHKQL